MLCQRANLLKLIRRLKDPVPQPLRRAVEGTNDLATLERWFDAALSAATIADLRRQMNIDS